MLENISQEQFEHIINVLIVYKQLNPKKDVYLSEKSVKDAISFMSKAGKDYADKLGLN
tara:strand:- start:755 stop:928 length:174 start_codon:yes stop_codon:yes gene_type:complete